MGREGGLIRAKGSALESGDLPETFSENIFEGKIMNSLRPLLFCLISLFSPEKINQ
jgi:hypothetical protein